MKLSRAEIAARSHERRAGRGRSIIAFRNLEFWCLLLAAAVTVTGLYSVYLAKANGLDQEQAATINLNRISGPQQLIPFLSEVSSAADREFVASRIYNLKRHGVELGNVGTLALLRVNESDVRGERGLTELTARMNLARDLRARREEMEAEEGANRWLRWRGRAPGELSVPLLTASEFASLKPHLRVRDGDSFRRRVLVWGTVFVAAFFLVHLWWRVRGFRGDEVILPVVQTLCGVGLILMLSLRDPLRDTLIFSDFCQGVVAGCAALCLFSLPDYSRRFSRLSYVPLLLALLLALALGIFGTGPGGSDAKVNLLFFQPMELIRILLLFFLAGYFAQNWDALRYLRQPQSTTAQRQKPWVVPRLDYVLPVVAAVALAIALFFWLGDLGPALVLVSVFLTMYSIARNRILLAGVGLAAVVLAFAIGYATGYPHTVRERVAMWMSPWDNQVRGGDQLADSLWALSAGGTTGTGLGLGDPQTVPAAHTDLVVSAFGEEAGVLGIVALYGLYGVLIYRTLRIAAAGTSTYAFFLVTGVALLTAYQLLLITGGLLGLIPLSGVVSPFLSYGKTSMVANCALFGIVLALSSRSEKQETQSVFRTGTRALVTVLAALLVVVMVRFLWIGSIRADRILVQPSLIIQADGVRRYQYNPRLLAVAREIPKGTIYDRNGIPLATSNWSQVEAHRADYGKLGVQLEQTTSASDTRHYPLGAPMFYLLGDVRSRLKQGARNTAFQEGASRIRLQGYDDVSEVEELRDPATGRITPTVRRDLRELIPLLRHRYEPDNPLVKELHSRPRDIHMSIDAALQMRVSEILAQRLMKLGKSRGAVVVLDPATGDTLAAVSYPWPTRVQMASLEQSTSAPLPDGDLLDRARFGLYPPGSSFKVVTAIAALRKDPGLATQRFNCIRLPDGRNGNFVWKREIRDDIKDTVPHGSVDLRKGLVVSCNAFFAQLGAHDVGASMLFDTASRLGINVAAPNTAGKLQQYLPQASYGQGQVVASPFQMARVAATIANAGNVPEGRWILDETNTRNRAPVPLLPATLAKQIGSYMRSVVTSGTGRVLNAAPLQIAGKTGTAELAKAPSHAWFIGFAPYEGGGGKQIAFAVLVENGQYGGTAAAPIAGDLVAAAHQLGII